MLGASLEEMWDEIERFGIKRALVDPNGDFSQEQVAELYGRVKERGGCSCNGDEGKQDEGSA